jgi:hypothetical protein
MPPLARNLVDSNSLVVIAAWINSLPGPPALAPPNVEPGAGTFFRSVTVSLGSPDGIATVYYTLDGSLPSTNSLIYFAPFTLTNTTTVNANAFEDGYINSVASGGVYNVLPGVILTSANAVGDGRFQAVMQGVPGRSYVLESTTNFTEWVMLGTNSAGDGTLYFTDPLLPAAPLRFYRVLQLP